MLETDSFNRDRVPACGEAKRGAGGKTFHSAARAPRMGRG